MSQRGLATLFALALLLMPSVALACPACAGNDHNPTSILLLLAAFVSFPFVLFGVVLVTVRRVVRRERQGSPALVLAHPNAN